MDIPGTITALRSAMGETQQGLAVRLGVAMSTIYKYEKGRMPEPGQLMRLKQIAEDAGQPKLATIFRDQMYKELGVPDSWEGVAPFEPKNDTEKVWVAGLLLCLRNPQITEGRAAVFEALQSWTELAWKAIRNAQVQRKVVRELRAGFKKAADAGHGEWDEEKGRYTLYRKDQLPADWDVTLGSDEGAVAQIEALMKTAKPRKDKASGSGNR